MVFSGEGFNAIFRGYLYFHEAPNICWALILLNEIKGSGTCLNVFTLSSALKAWAAIGVKELSRVQLHYCLIKINTDLD